MIFILLQLCYVLKFRKNWQAFPTVSITTFVNKTCSFFSLMQITEFYCVIRIKKKVRFGAEYPPLMEQTEVIRFSAPIFLPGISFARLIFFCRFNLMIMSVAYRLTLIKLDPFWFVANVATPALAKAILNVFKNAEHKFSF